jgi:predicted phage baseplate assembly protein
MLNAESGEIRFGDGMRGSRPPEGAQLRADYDYSLGAEGNVGAGSINAAPALPPGFSVANPIPTWGGADSETVAQGEKQISRYLQHRDRLVTAADFQTITLRTPGVDIGRVEVVPNFNPELAGSQPGDAAGAITLMIVPSYDAQQPDAPRPDRLFLDTICTYLDSRRLITTEVFLRGPNYRGIWISIGIKVVAGLNDAPVREAVKQAILAFLSPLPSDAASGWPLNRSVIDLEISAVAARVPNVDFIQPPILIAEGQGAAVSRIDLVGLDLPRVLGISVSSAAPMDIDALRGLQVSTNLGPTVVQVPVIPEECS